MWNICWWHEIFVAGKYAYWKYEFEAKFRNFSLTLFDSFFLNSLNQTIIYFLDSIVFQFDFVLSYIDDVVRYVLRGMKSRRI